MTRLAGIDPSLTATGIIVLNRTGFGRNEVEDFAVVRTKPEEGPGRLCVIRKVVADSLAGEPGVCAVEQNYVNRGAQSSMAQREVVGICVEVAASLGWHVVRVAPTQAKKALGLVGGGSDKAQMVLPASRLFPDLFAGIKFKYQREAVADAIGNAMVAAQPRHLAAAGVLA